MFLDHRNWFANTYRSQLFKRKWFRKKNAFMKPVEAIKLFIIVISEGYYKAKKSRLCSLEHEIFIINVINVMVHWFQEHNEDILCCAFTGPNHLATGSYDGEIVIWNTNSEHISRRLNQRSRRLLMKSRQKSFMQARKEV